MKKLAKILKELQHIISRSCVYFTIAIFIALAMANHSLKGNTISVLNSDFFSIKSAVFTYLSVFLLSSIDLVLKIPHVPSPILRVLHYILCMSTLIIPIFTNNGFNAYSNFMIIYFIIITVIYIILTLITSFVKLITDNKKKDSEYESIL